MANKAETNIENNQALLETLAAMKAELATFAPMKAELATLRHKVANIENTQQTIVANPAVEPGASGQSTSRRRMLRRLAGTIGAVALVVGAALPVGEAQARFISNPSGTNNQIGAIIVPPGTTTPSVNLSNNSAKYGLIAVDSSDALDLRNTPGYNTGVYGHSTGFGVYGDGLLTGVRGTGAIGVYGNGTGTVDTTGVFGQGFASGINVYGVRGFSNVCGVYGEGQQGNNRSSTGVQGIGTNGVYGEGTNIGVKGQGIAGVYGSGTSTGVYGSAITANKSDGSVTGVYGFGADFGVSGNSIDGIGVSANSSGLGLSNPALKAYNDSSAGITAVFSSNTSDTCLVIGNSNANGSLFKAFVNGNQKIRFDGTGRGFFNGGTQTGGADLAEFIPVALSASLNETELEAGEVVEIDPTQPGMFRRCATSGSLAVAGVISTQPGVTLGAIEPASQENSGPRLALAGRIPVKVTDEGGPIQPGDLLVASSTPGHARLAPFPAEQGSVVGKALGCLSSGAGLVEMLVMLR